MEGLLSDTDFINYCLGDESAEANQWGSYVPVNSEDTHVIEEAKRCVLVLTGVLPQEVVNAKLDRFRKLFDETQNKKITHVQQKTNKVQDFIQFVKIGIAALLFLIAGYLFLSKNTPDTAHTFEQIRGKKFVTHSDTRKTIVLADGTEAILYPGSQLVVSTDFNEKDRKIAVYGQVYFKIFHQKEKPFIAYSKYTTTTAIGTAFYVRDFANSKTSSVLLINGKVKVQEPAQAKTQFLEPGMSVEVDQKTLKVTKKSIDKDELLALADHKLYFDNTDMNSIVSKLELFYGIEIDISSCNCEFKKITGDYSNHSLTSVLNTISYINHVSWTLDNYKVVFKPLVSTK